MFPVLAIFWLVSLARVVLGLVWDRTHGVEFSLALVAVLIVPALVRRRIALFFSRWRSP